MHMWTVFAVRFDTVAISNKELHLHYVSSCSPSLGASRPHHGPRQDCGHGLRQTSAVGDVGAGPRRNGSGSGAQRATSDPDLSVLVAGLGGRLARAALATGDLDGGWARAEELGCERPRRPHGRAVELGGLTSGQCRGRTSTDDSAPVRVGEMYRGERHCIFAPPLSSKVNWLLHWFVCLLEEEIAMYSDFRKPFFPIACSC
jgi:hypothetical protein